MEEEGEVCAMKKIPTLFERVYINHNKVDILQNVTTGMEWVLDSVVENGKNTEKIDVGEI